LARATEEGRTDEGEKLVKETKRKTEENGEEEVKEGDIR